MFSDICGQKDCCVVCLGCIMSNCKPRRRTNANLYFGILGLLGEKGTFKMFVVKSQDVVDVVGRVGINLDHN